MKARTFAAVVLLMVGVTGCGSLERRLTVTGGAGFSGPVAAPGLVRLPTAPSLAATAPGTAVAAPGTAVAAARTARAALAATAPQEATTCVKPLRAGRGKPRPGLCQTGRHDRLRPESHPPALPAGGPQRDAG